MIHHVFACRSNIGDWLSARGIQVLIGSPPVREHLCDEPFVPDTLEALSQAGCEDLVIIGGGGLFMDYFEPFWRGFQPLAERLNFCIWGVGYCDLKGQPSRLSDELLHDVISHSRLCVVRDELTRTYLADSGLPPAVPCPSLAAVTPSPQPGHGVLHVVHYDVIGEPGYASMRAMALDFARQTRRPYDEIDNQIPDGSEEALQTTLARYAAADVIISSRLHGCILGLAMGRKVVAVSGDRKIEGFMRAAGLEQWLCEPDELKRLPGLLGRLEQQASTSEFVTWARKQNKQIARMVTRMANSAPAAMWELQEGGGRHG